MAAATTPKNAPASDDQPDETAPATPQVQDAEKKVHVSALIPQSTFNKLEDFRWANRLNKSQVIEVALEDFCSRLD